MGGNSANYIIQETDYTNFAVVFSYELPGFNLNKFSIGLVYHSVLVITIFVG